VLQVIHDDDDDSQAV